MVSWLDVQGCRLRVLSLLLDVLYKVCFAQFNPRSYDYTFVAAWQNILRAMTGGDMPDADSRPSTRSNQQRPTATSSGCFCAKG